MPNWCENNLTIMGSKQQLDDLMSKVAIINEGGYERYSILDRLYPCPPELLATPSGFSTDEVEQAERNIKEEQNLATYGYRDWYDWCNDNWGTKWGDSDTSLVDDSDEVKEFYFESAWSPPVEGIINISKLYPDLIFSMSWHEGGCDFWGACAYQNGEGNRIDGNISDIEGINDIDYDNDDWQGDMNDNYDLILNSRDEAEVEMIRTLNDNAKVGA